MKPVLWIAVIASLTLSPAGEASPVASDTPSLKLSQTDVDFGDVIQGSLVRRDLVLENAGTGTLEVSRVGANCQCASLRLATRLRPNIRIDTHNEGAVDLQLKAGQKATLAIIVDTTKLAVGEIKKRCLVFANDEASPHSVEFRLNIQERKIVPLPPVSADDHDHGAEGALPEVLGPPPRVEADPLTIHVGELLRGEKAEATFELKSTGEGPLVVTSVNATCQCTASALIVGDVTFDKDEIQNRSRSKEVVVLEPGTSALLKVAMDTASLPSVRYDTTTRKSVRVYTNDLAHNPLMLNIEADIRPAFTLEPQYVRFPVVRKGEAAELSVFLQSDQIDNYQLESIELTNPNALISSFTQIGADEAGRPKYEIKVALRPDAPIGRLNDQLVLHFRHERVHELRVPVYCEVQPQVVFHGNQDDGSDRLNFGVISGAEDTTVEMQIENLQPDVPYVPTGIELTSRHPEGSFAYELVEVVPGVQYVVKVTVKKSVQDRFFSGRLRITAQHPDLPVKLIDFRGWVDPARAAAAAAAASGDQSKGAEDR